MKNFGNSLLQPYLLILNFQIISYFAYNIIFFGRANFHYWYFPKKEFPPKNKKIQQKQNISNKIINNKSNYFNL